MNRTLAALALILSLIGGALQASPLGTDPPLLSPKQLRHDLDRIRELLTKTHPGIHFSADLAALRSALVRVEQELVRPMTKEEAWRHFSTLNPVFGDAHVSVINPDPRTQTSDLLKSGQGLFPFEVNVNPAGQVYLLSELGGAPTSYAGSSVERINGVPIEDLARALLARTNGDTAAFRAANLSTRWWWFYWKVFGSPQTFEIEVKQASKTVVIQVPARQELPVWLTQSDATNFDRAFRFWNLNEDIAVLTINTFDSTEKNRFYEFTQDAFSRLRSSKTKVLIVDIRKNGGGDDDMWKNGVLRYIATKPYRHGSSFVLRVIEGRQRDGQKVGDVVEGQIQGWTQPIQDQNLVFKGKVYVLVGGATYSSAVLFANVVQDFGFGSLVGVGGYARTRQSGGTQTYTLPNSELGIVVPRFVLDRPSGSRDPMYLTPDIALDDDPFDSERVWTLLRSQLSSDGIAK